MLSIMLHQLLTPNVKLRQYILASLHSPSKNYTFLKQRSLLSPIAFIMSSRTKVLFICEQKPLLEKLRRFCAKTCVTAIISVSNQLSNCIKLTVPRFAKKKKQSSFLSPIEVCTKSAKISIRVRPTPFILPSCTVQPFVLFLQMIAKKKGKITGTRERA